MSLEDEITAEAERSTKRLERKEQGALQDSLGFKIRSEVASERICEALIREQQLVRQDRIDAARRKIYQSIIEAGFAYRGY